MIKKKPIDYDKALLRMTTLCARAEHCEWEIRDKLRRAGLPAADTERVIDYLVTHRFVDNTRYARAYASDKARFSGHGRRKIRMELLARRIDERIIAEALDAIDDNIYDDTLMKMTRSRGESLDMEDYNDRAKLYRRLVSRGYEPPLVTRAISRLRSERREAEE